MMHVTTAAATAGEAESGDRDYLERGQSGQRCQLQKVEQVQEVH